MGQETTPGAVAVVGARDGDLWTYLLFENLSRFGPDRPIWPISWTRDVVRGRTTYQSLDELPATPEVAVLAVAADRALDLVARAAAAEIPHVVIISSGFAERGDDIGRSLQADLQKATAGSRSRVYGPNGVGFADLAAGLCPLGAPVPPDLAPGNVSVISQSGSITSSVLAGLAEDGAGVDWCVSVGNGACFDVVDAIETALNRDSTRVLTGYVESFGAGERSRLERVLARAQDQRVPFVLLRGGMTTLGAQVTKSHTAAMTSPQRLVGEVLARHDVVVVPDIESLVRTAAICSYEQRQGRHAPVSSGVAVIETSGGAAAVLADMMAEHELRLARFSQTTVDALAACAPPGAFVANPIDLTASPKPFDEVTEAFRSVYLDPDVGWVMIPFALTFPTIEDGRKVHKVALDRYAELGRQTGTNTVISTLSVHGWTDWAREFRARYPGVLLLRGVASTVRALRALTRTEEAAGPREPTPDDRVGDVVAEGVPDLPAARRVLELSGVPMPPGRFVDQAELTSLAQTVTELRFPVVVKLVADGLLHKAKVSGVVTHCRSPEDAMSAALRVLEAAASSGIDAEGVFVEEMVNGPEVFVSLDRDPWYGPFLLLAPGGGDVEESDATQLVPLPASSDHLRSALQRAERAWGVSVASDAMATFVDNLAGQFLDGPLSNWETVELNPVIVTEAGPYPVDVVLVPAVER